MPDPGRTLDPPGFWLLPRNEDVIAATPTQRGNGADLGLFRRAVPTFGRTKRLWMATSDDSSCNAADRGFAGNRVVNSLLTTLGIS